MPCVVRPRSTPGRCVRWSGGDRVLASAAYSQTHPDGDRPMTLTRLRCGMVVALCLATGAIRRPRTAARAPSTKSRSNRRGRRRRRPTTRSEPIPPGSSRRSPRPARRSTGSAPSCTNLIDVRYEMSAAIAELRGDLAAKGAYTADPVLPSQASLAPAAPAVPAADAGDRGPLATSFLDSAAPAERPLPGTARSAPASSRPGRPEADGRSSSATRSSRLAPRSTGSSTSSWSCAGVPAGGGQAFGGMGAWAGVWAGAWAASHVRPLVRLDGGAGQRGGGFH